MEKDHKTEEKLNIGELYTGNSSSSSAIPLSAKHQQILNQHLPIGIVESSLEGHYLDVNEEFCRMLGYERDELLQRGIREVTDEEDYHIDSKLHGRLAAGEISYYKIEKRFVRKDGQIIWADLTRCAIRDAHGNPLYTVGIILDITERHLAEEAMLRARTKAERTADRIARLQKITAALTGIATTEQVAEMILGQGTQATRAAAGILAEVVKNSGEIRTLATLGYPSAAIRTSPEVGPLSTRAPLEDCILSKQAIWLGSRSAFASQYPESVELWDSYGHQATAAFPLIVGDRVLGGLSFSFVQAREFDQEEREFLLAVAQHCAQALERAHSEDTLRESERKFSLIYDKLPFAATLTRPQDGLLLDVNEAFEKLFGYSKRDVIGKTLQDLGLVPDAEARERILAELQERHSVRGIELKLATKTYGTRVLLANLDLVENQGEIYILQTDQDITERKQALEALRESEERFRAILSQATAGIVRKDTDGTLMFVNDAFCNMVGYTSSELVTEGKTCWDLTHPDDVEENKRLFARMLTEAIPFQMERRLIRKDGSILWANVSVSPIKDASGYPVSAVGVEVDITARKQAEKALHQLNLGLESRVEERTAELQTMNEMLNQSRRRLQFLSHRLVQVQEEERRSLARELHDRVGQNLMALKLNMTIVEGGISRGYTEQLGMRLADSMQLVTEVITLVRDVMSNLRPTLLDDYGLESALQAYIDEFQTRYGIAVQFEKQSPPLPRLESSLEITLLRISQEALTNIARHAQASQAVLSLRLDEKQVYLTIEDNGIGISTLEGEKRPRSHGLKIMRERAEALEGTLTLRTTSGKGTKIEVVIPVLPREPDTNA
jgi:PAS domain S-box-containing protein